MQNVKEQAALAFHGLQEIRSVIAKHSEVFSSLGCSVSIEGYTRNYGTCRSFTEADISRAAWYKYIEQLMDATEEQKKRLISKYAEPRYQSPFFWEADAEISALECAADERRQEAKQKVLTWLFRCMVREDGRYVEKNHAVLPQKIRIHALPCVSASAKNPSRPRQTYDTEQLDNLEAMLSWELKGRLLDGPGLGSRIVEIWNAEWCDKRIRDVKTMQFSCEFFQLRAYKSGNVEMTFTPEALAVVNAEEPKDQTTLALEALITSRGLSPRSIPRREVKDLLDDALAQGLLEPMVSLISRRFGHTYDVDDYMDLRAYREAQKAADETNSGHENPAEGTPDADSKPAAAVEEGECVSGSTQEAATGISSEAPAKSLELVPGSDTKEAADQDRAGPFQESAPSRIQPEYAELLRSFLDSMPALPVLGRSTLSPRIAMIMETSRRLLDGLAAGGYLDLDAAGSLTREAFGIRSAIESKRTASNSKAIETALIECESIESLGRAFEEIMGTLSYAAPETAAPNATDTVPQSAEVMRIHYSEAQGALVHGVKAEDKEVHKVLHTFGFRWSARIGEKGAWYKPGTRRKPLNKHLCLRLIEITEALTELGRGVVLETEESPRKAA